MQTTLTIYCRECGAILQNLSDIKQEDKSPCGNCGLVELGVKNPELFRWPLI